MKLMVTKFPRDFWSMDLRESREGTVYPLLLRMEKNGLIEAEYKASVLGPKRKYFSITEKGREELEKFLKSFREMEAAVNHVFGQEV